MQTVWEFNTARFRVALEIEPEEMDPAESFQFEEDIEAVRSGAVEWFGARVSVYLDDTRIVWDYLGGCAYETVKEFYTSHRDADPMNRNCEAYRAVRGSNACVCHYFPGMVSQAISEARTWLNSHPEMRTV